jgi:UDP-glucuronate 4-epimerase
VIDCLERALGTTFAKELVPMQPGDVAATYADIDDLIRDIGFRPTRPIEVGIERFAA